MTAIAMPDHMSELPLRAESNENDFQYLPLSPAHPEMSAPHPIRSSPTVGFRGSKITTAALDCDLRPARWHTGIAYVGDADRPRSRVSWSQSSATSLTRGLIEFRYCGHQIFDTAGRFIPIIKPGRKCGRSPARPIRRLDRNHFRQTVIIGRLTPRQFCP
jgi:hypothetical protein